MTKHPGAGCVALLAVALAAGGCVINLDADQVVVREEKQFKVGPGLELTVESFDGSIQVQSWDLPEVRVEAQKRGPDRDVAAALEVRSSQEGNRIRVEAVAPRESREFVGFGRNSSPSVSFLVRLPKDVKLTATTRDGSITIDNITGAVNLKSGDGSIRANGVNGDFTAHTADGSVTLVDVNGRVSLESGDGSLRVEGRVDSLHAKSRDGSIVIEADDGSVMKDDWQISTGDGSITFRVPRNFNAEIDADTRDGRVSSGIDGLRASSDDDDDRGTLRGRIGSGGRTVTLRTGDGSISVSNR